MLRQPANWSAHSLHVAYYMRANAERMGLDPDEMFICGLLHDIGYTAINEDERHELIGSEMLRKIGVKDNIIHAIKLHGYSIDKVIEIYGKEALTAEYYLLTEADGHIDSKGNYVSYEERLEDTKSRYGEDSYEYKNSLECYNSLKSRNKK